MQCYKSRWSPPPLVHSSPPIYPIVSPMVLIQVSTARLGLPIRWLPLLSHNSVATSFSNSFYTFPLIIYIFKKLKVTGPLYTGLQSTSTLIMLPFMQLKMLIINQNIM